MAPALQVRDPTPSMRVQRNYSPRRNASLKNADALIFQQQLMERGSSHERVKRVRPGPLFRVRKNRVFAHAVLGKRIRQLPRF